MVEVWLRTDMFRELDGQDQTIAMKRVIDELSDHPPTLSHLSPHHSTTSGGMGLNVLRMEDDQDLHDAVLSVHRAPIQTLASTNAMEVIENQDGIAHISMGQRQSPS